jgi:hypothetical protein
MAYVEMKKVGRETNEQNYNEPLVGGISASLWHAKLRSIVATSYIFCGMKQKE